MDYNTDLHFIFSLSDGYKAIRLRNPFVPPLTLR